MKAFQRFFCLGLGTIFLSGCVSFLPEEPAASKKIVLDPQLAPSINGHKVSEALIIEKPLMLGSLDSTRLKIILEDESGVAFSDVIAGIEWSDRLPNLLQEIMIRMFEESKSVESVGRPEENFRAIYKLQITVTNLEIIKMIQTSMKAKASVSAKIINSLNKQVIAQHTFSSEATIRDHNLKAFIQALNKAISPCLSELITWVHATVSSSAKS